MRRVGVAGREHDLDGGRKQSRAQQRVAGLAENASNRRGRRLDVSLREPQQREPGLRLPPVAVRFAVRGLRGAELALQAVELPLLVERLSGGDRIHRLVTAFARECASASASSHAPCSCMIQARCARQRPVNDTI